MATGFVAYRDDHKKVWLYKTKSTASRNRVRDVRWGDYLNIVEQDASWVKIKWGRKHYFIEASNVDNKRPVELIFIDVGQGDGCLFVSSETGTSERIMIIDAGVASNTYNFMKWRFGKFARNFDFHAAVITHPDQDHYYGFRKLFNHEKVGFRHVYHNGLMERVGSDLLGPSDPTGAFLTDLAETDAQARALYSDTSVRGSKRYPNLIFDALQSSRIGPVEMLSTKHGVKHNNRCFMPGFAPNDPGLGDIEVLGPVPETVGGKTALRWFGDDIGSTAQNNGKTKNGHSVILRLKVKDFSLLFGGDLNRPAEDYLLRHYSRISKTKPLSSAVTPARKRLECDVMKCCHHGASDVTNEFIRAVNAFGFVISSGDNESHAHPRPELLGRLGKLGRSSAPMLFCTEILRSTSEKGKEKDYKALRKLDKTVEQLAAQHATLLAIVNPTASNTAALKAKKKELKEARSKRRKQQDHIKRRNVGVYGAITMRTDGKHLEISWRLESPRGKQLWQSYILENTGGNWKVVSGGH